MTAIETTHQWARELAKKSPLIGRMQLIKRLGTDSSLDKIARNFANSDEHNRLIIRGIDSLISKDSASEEDAESLLVNILLRNTYGAFCELSAYEWIMQRDIRKSGDTISIFGVS